MEKIDHEKFARAVLWHLSAIETGVKMLHNNAVRDAGQDAGASDREILDETVKNLKLIRKTAEHVYQASLKRAGIPPSPDFPPPFSANGHGGI